MILNTQQFLLAALIGLFLINPLTAEGQSLEPVRMEGSVFAVQSKISDPSFVLDSINQQTIYVLVSRFEGEEVTERIVKLRHVFKSTKDALPKKVFEPVSDWSFIARRNPNCDEVIESWHNNERIEIIDSGREVFQKGPVECFDLSSFEKISTGKLEPNASGQCHNLKSEFSVNSRRLNSAGGQTNDNNFEVRFV